MQICHNISHLILIFLANQGASSPLLHFELSLGYSWCSYQSYEAWKSLARHCKIRKIDSEGCKREHCVLFPCKTSLHQNQNRVLENRRLLKGSKLQFRGNKGRKLLELHISHGTNFRSYLHRTVKCLSLVEQNEKNAM